MAIDKDFKVKHGLVVSTTATILSTSNSVSTTTGALQVAGGAGIQKDVWVGGKIYSQNAEVITTSTIVSTRSFVQKTSAYTAAAGDLLIADTSGGAFTITLPANPATGTTVVIADGADWATNNLTVARNGSTIEGQTDDALFDIKGAYVTLIYDGATWELFVSVPSSPISIVNNTTTNSSYYIPFVNTATGVLTGLEVSSSKLYFNPNTGQLNATEFNSLSDRQFKENISVITSGLEIVNQISPVEFTWKSNNKKAYGVIAQEIEQVLPEIVSTDDNGVKTVAYSQIIPFLVAAIKDLQKEINELRNR